MEYISAKEAAKKWFVSERRVQFYCSNGKISGAKSLGKQWLIPADAERPIDGRTKISKESTDTVFYHFPLYVFSPMYSSDMEDCLEEEVKLKKAQLLLLEGKYSEALLACREILSISVPDFVKMGAYFTISFAEMLLGLFDKTQSALHRMEVLTEKETLHKEDYKLLVASLVHHTTWDPKLFYDIDIRTLSADAVYYYEYLLVMLDMMLPLKKSVFELKAMEVYCRRVEATAITPLSLYANAIYATTLVNAGEAEKSKIHVKKACDLTSQYGWTTCLAKTYFGIAKHIDVYLQKTNPKLLTKVQTLARISATNWRAYTMLSQGKMPVDYLVDMNNNDFELYNLIQSNCSAEQIAIILERPLPEIKSEITKLCSLYHCDTQKDLVAFISNQWGKLLTELPIQ